MRGNMTAQRWHFWLFCAVLLTGSAALAAKEAKLSIETIFSALSFRPHFPDEKDFVAKYGEGFVLREEGERFRIYYLPETSLWLRLEIEENRVESYVVGILLSKLPLSSERRSPRYEITEVTIRGVKLGDLPSRLDVNQPV